MKTNRRSFASISVLELAAGAASLVLCAVTLTAVAQTPTPTPTPPTTVGTSIKPPVAADPPKVLADPETRIYSRCTTRDERQAPGAEETPYKPNAKAEVMTEDAAKAKGFKAGAHKVTCP
jgi:hypothetical protein